MSRKQNQRPGRGEQSESNRKKIALLCALVALAAAGITAFAIRKAPGALPGSKEKPHLEISGPITYSKHVAPILFQHCSGCHRPGQSGPFDLLTFADAKRHASDIADVTARRYMPPWLPEHGYGEFEHERRLSDLELETIQRWVAEGAVEGDPRDLPAAPQWTGGWQLGEPDLVLETAPYALASEGQDVYYNFVVPIATAGTRFVKGVEFLPGNNRAVHHAFVNIDETRNSRRLGAKQNPPGFVGMDLPETVLMPGGQLLGWQPGKIPSFAAQGLAWVLRTDTDLVLQVHMNPSGKPERVQPRVGFHFTDQPPTNTAFRIRLTALELDIPAGASNYVAERSYTLPVDVSMVRVGAHAHYLARDMQGFALLPNGEKKWLLWIKDWDFKWQGDYQYKEPVQLPKGSKVVMRFTYDNSTNNLRNPHHPPKRILWGLNTTDEMGELYFQAMPRNQQDYNTLGAHYMKYFMQVSMDYYRFRVKENPQDADGHQRLGRSLATIGQMSEAIVHLTEAIRLQPKNDLAHFDLGSIYLRQRKLPEAYREFVEVTRLNPEDSQAYGSLGIICLETGRWQEAEEHLHAALRLNPDDPLATKYLAALRSRIQGQ